MNFVAIKMLVGDRAKYLGIIMGLTFASLLITQQAAIFCGLMTRTFNAVNDLSYPAHPGLEKHLGCAHGGGGCPSSGAWGGGGAVGGAVVQGFAVGAAG